MQPLLRTCAAELVHQHHVAISASAVVAAARHRLPVRAADAVTATSIAAVHVATLSPPRRRRPSYGCVIRASLRRPFTARSSSATVAFTPSQQQRRRWLSTAADASELIDAIAGTAAAAKPPQAASVASSECFDSLAALREHIVMNTAMSPDAAFQLCEQHLHRWSSHPHALDQWRDCVQLLAVMRDIAANAAPTDAATAASAVAGRASAAPPQLSAQPGLTVQLHHYHAVLRSLLIASAPECLLDCSTSPLYPSNMQAAVMSDDLLSFCIGTQTTADTDTHAHSQPRVLAPFTPNLAYYSQLLQVIQDSANAVQSTSGRNARTNAQQLFGPDGAGDSPQQLRDNRVILLAQALERCRFPSHIQAELVDANAADPQQRESGLVASTMQGGGLTQSPETPPTDAAADADTVSDVQQAVSDMPPLAVSRHLFNALVAADIEPTTETFNLLLAIADAHQRSSLLPNLLQTASNAAAAATEQGDSRHSTNATAFNSHMSFLWTIYEHTMAQLTASPDLFSVVLLLRLCYMAAANAHVANGGCLHSFLCGDATVHSSGNRVNYNRMCTVLDAYELQSRLLRRLSEVLHGYQFVQPHLFLLSLTHASRAVARIYSNERMEFLGDAAIDFIVRTMLIECIRAKAMEHIQATGVKTGQPKLTAVEELRRMQNLSRHGRRHESGDSSFAFPPIDDIVRPKGALVSTHRLATLSDSSGLSHLLAAANDTVRTTMSAQSAHNKQFRTAFERYVATLQAQSKISAPAPRADSDSVAGNNNSPTTVKMAADVFEAVLAAMLLDAPESAAGSAAPALPSAVAASASAPTRLQGVQNVHSFLARCMSAMTSELVSGVVFSTTKHEHRMRKGRTGVLAPPVLTTFDATANYKTLLEDAVRRRYAITEANCRRVRIIYVSRGQINAHTYRVQVQVQSSPTIAAAVDAACGFTSQLSASIPFNQCPRFDSRTDRAYPIAIAGPEVSDAEQQAAFLALQSLVDE